MWNDKQNVKTKETDKIGII